MELIKNNMNDPTEIINRKEKFFYAETYETYNYLYPNVHSITNQMRLLKLYQDKVYIYYVS